MSEKLSDLVDGVPMNDQEQAWLKNRLTNMTVKEGLLFSAAVKMELPIEAIEYIHCATHLERVQLCYGAKNDCELGEFVLQEMGSAAPEARKFINLNAIGRHYRREHGGIFLGGHFMNRETPLLWDCPLEQTALPSLDSGYAMRLKLASQFNPDGVWVGFPDYGCTDPSAPDELLLALDELGVESADECEVRQVNCVFPQLTDIMHQYESAGPLVEHAVDFGYAYAGQGQGEPYYLEKWQAVMELEDCHRLDFALDLSQNLGSYEFCPRGVNLEEYGKELALRAGLVIEGGFQSAYFDYTAYAETHIKTCGLSATDHGYVAWNGRELIYEYSKPPERGGLHMG